MTKMNRLTAREDGKAVFTKLGAEIYCSSQATCDVICSYEEALEDAFRYNNQNVDEDIIELLVMLLTSRIQNAYDKALLQKQKSEIKSLEEKLALSENV